MAAKTRGTRPPRPPGGTGLPVACAVIEEGGLVLATQRSAAMSLPLKWEFPGGKIRRGESAAACLHRELGEELGIAVRVREELPARTHRYPALTVTLHPFRCAIAAGTPVLHEHAAAVWLPPGRLRTLDWAEADLPVVEDYLARTTARARGGRDAGVRFAVGACSLGSLLAARSGRGLCAVFLGDDPGALVRELLSRFPGAVAAGGGDALERQIAAIAALVEAPRRGLDLPLDLRGTAFQERVWRALRRIPAGATVSYKDLARGIGAPGAARAVAQACGRNPLAVVIPCHRVVRSDGALAGYRWGIGRKRALLEREREPPLRTAGG